ncbi:MAG: ZPR1 zinc finger domain-containing protein [Candidatus Lokiarchaeota archaeon]|nr:ZPR1 zinc finger domain-containing protein [Candidatus Lokiarchaeota archaeon]
MGKDWETKPSLEEKYSLPEIQDIPCPSCTKGILQISRNVHTLPDGEDILILLMECNACSFRRNDIIPLRSAFAPGTYSLTINDGDLTSKIFRSPTGVIELPEADFEIEPGASAEYWITNVEGILKRMIQFTNVMLTHASKDDANYQKIESTLEILLNCLQGTSPFHLILRDTIGGSYIASTKTDNLQFEPIKNKE